MICSYYYSLSYYSFILSFVVRGYSVVPASANHAAILVCSGVIVTGSSFIRIQLTYCDPSGLVMSSDLYSILFICISIKGIA